MINSLFGFLPTVLAHHPFGMEEISLSPLQGFLSGVAHTTEELSLIHI